LIQITAGAVIRIPHRAHTHSQAKAKLQGPKHKHTPTHPSPKAIELAKQIKDLKDRLHHLHKAKQGEKKSHLHPSTQPGDTQLIKDLKDKRNTLQIALTKEIKETAAKRKALNGLSSELQLTPHNAQP
jgi:hypothetical protein